MFRRIDRYRLGRSDSVLKTKRYTSFVLLSAGHDVRAQRLPQPLLLDLAVVLYVGHVARTSYYTRGEFGRRVGNCHVSPTRPPYTKDTKREKHWHRRSVIIIIIIVIVERSHDSCDRSTRAINITNNGVVSRGRVVRSR